MESNDESESTRETPHMEMDDIIASFQSMADANNSLMLKVKQLEDRLMALEGKQ